MKDPAILFYTSDFITGTLTMSDEQRGKYILLLCLQHQKGYLTEKDMLNICKTYDKDIYDKFKQNGDGHFYNERMKIETERRLKYSESRRNNRNAKKIEDEKESNISESYDEHMETVTINEDNKKGIKFQKPTIPEIKSYCIERKNKVDAEYFFDHYEARGWMLKKEKMKDWKAAVRTWEKNDFNNGKQPEKSNPYKPYKPE